MTTREHVGAALADLKNGLAHAEICAHPYLRKIALFSNRALSLRHEVPAEEQAWLTEELRVVARSHGISPDCIIQEDRSAAPVLADLSAAIERPVAA